MACAALPALGTVPAAAQLVPVPGQEYREIVDPRRPVSGSLVVGISVHRSDADYRPELHVWIPAAAAPALQLRVDLDSADARFSGSGLFAGGVRAGDWAPLTLLADQRSSRKPAELTGDALAVAVRPAAAGAPQAMLVAGWATANLKDAATLLRVQVNSRRAEIYAEGAEPGRLEKCARVASASTVRFDSVCLVRASSLVPLPNGLHELRLLRRDGASRERVTALVWM